MELYRELYSPKNDADIFVDDSEVDWIAPKTEGEFQALMEDLKSQGVLD